MKFSILSLFPEIIQSYFSASIMARAVERGVITYNNINIRDFAFDKHKTCDDAPYGGGAGMLLLSAPLAGALQYAGVRKKSERGSDYAKKTIYLSPSGVPFNQTLASSLSREEEIVLVCGRYEGIDQRIIDLYVDSEVSIGDYVLSSGELAALVLIDAVSRLIDSVITNESLLEESFASNLLEYPQWTRPEVFEGLAVPEVLLSGHHEKIRKWRLRQRIIKTLRIRPDIIADGIQKGLYGEEILTEINNIKNSAC